MAKREEFTIDENELKHPFFGSARMTYTLCAFFALSFHHLMRSAVNLSILCMIAKPEFTENQKALTKTSECASDDFNDTVIPSHIHGDLHWTRSEEVIFPSTFFIGYVVTLPIAGLFADKYGGKVFFIYSIILEALIFLLMPVCVRNSFWLGTVMRCLQGVVAGLGNPAIYKLYSLWTHPTERTASIAFGFSGYNIGNLISYPLCAWLCTFGWDAVFYVLGSLSLASGVIMNFLVYNNIDQHPRISSKEYQFLKSVQKTKSRKHEVPCIAILTSAPFYAFALTHFCHNLSATMEAQMLPRYYTEAMGFTIQQTGNAMSVLFAGSVLAKGVAIILSSQIEKQTSLNLDIYRRSLHFICCWATLPFIIGILYLTCNHRLVVVVLWTCISIIADIAFSAGYWPSISFMAPSFSGLLVGIANSFGLVSVLVVSSVVSKIVPTGNSIEWQHTTGILIGVYILESLLFPLFGSSKLQPWGLIDEDEDRQG